MGNPIRFFSGLELRQGHTHTHTHHVTRLPALGPHRERTLIITSSCMYLLMGTYMLSIVEPPSTIPFITSFPSPHRAARRADGRHSTRKPSTTTPVRLVHLSHRWSGRPAIRRYASYHHGIMHNQGQSTTGDPSSTALANLPSQVATYTRLPPE